MDVNNTREFQQPLLENEKSSPVSSNEPIKKPKTRAQRAMRKTFKGTAHLSNLLPTGSVMAFQILSPILTRQGQCPTHTSRLMTSVLLATCSLTCFVLCFTDSFRDERGKVRYGVASANGLWVMDGSVRLSSEEASKYKVRFMDFFHGFASILVFAAVAMLDNNVVMCFDPNPSEDDKELLMALPLGIGLLCSLLFVAFPSKRHGIGFPLSRN